MAQTPPAVSALNGKVDYTGGSMNSAEGHNFSGSISVPVGHEFGFQADGLYSRIDDMDFYGGAGHLFWRNPEIGLIGLTGGYLQRSSSHSWNDLNTFQVGVEGEYYLNHFTFGLFAGAGSISYSLNAPFIDSNPTRFVGKISLGYYPVDDLLLQVSYISAFNDNLGKADLEYETPIRGLALTAEGAIGDNGYDHWLLGVRYYFGANKNLRERHRQDDPPGLMQQILHGLGVYGAEYNRKGEQYARRHEGSGGSDGSYGVISTTDTGSYGFEASRQRPVSPSGPGVSVPPTPMDPTGSQ